MAPVVSVHIADVGARHAIGLLARRPKARSIPGLRHAEIGAAAPLGPSLLPTPTLGRVGFIGFWDDEDAVERFVGRAPAGGPAQWRGGGAARATSPVRVVAGFARRPERVPPHRLRRPGG